MHARAHVSGVHEHGRYAPLKQFSGERACQHLERRLGCAVRSPARVRGRCRIAGDVHDQPALLDQQRQGLRRQHHRRAHVDRKEPAKARHVEDLELVLFLPSSDALLTSTSSPPSAIAASISAARTAGSVTSPATGRTTEACRDRSAAAVSSACAAIAAAYYQAAAAVSLGPIPGYYQPEPPAGTRDDRNSIRMSHLILSSLPRVRGSRFAVRRLGSASDFDSLRVAASPRTANPGVTTDACHLRSRMRLQVHLKSSEKWRRLPSMGDAKWRGSGAQRRGDVGPALLRGSSSDYG